MSRRPEPLRFDRVRGFGRIMADTRNFIRDNFVVFFKTILFLVWPIALLTCALQTFYQVNLVDPDEGKFNDRLGSYIALSAIYSQLRWAINGFVTVMVVSHFIKVYREKGQGKFEVNDVSKSILRDLFGNLLAFVILFLSVIIISIILGYLIYGMAEVSVGAAFLLIGAGALGYFLIRFPFWYFIFSVFFARTSGSKPINVFAAMGLAGRVFSGNWWMSWVIFFCMWLLLYIIGTLVSLPAQAAGSLIQLFSYEIDQSSTDWMLIQTVLISIGEFAKTIINSVFCISVALQFYSLKEKMDGEGTMQLVNSIGTKKEDDGIELIY